jgi:hypothetical protein
LIPWVGTSFVLAMTMFFAMWIAES